MKNLLRTVMILSALLSVSISCRKQEVAEPPLPVTYANINGTWELVSWKGQALAEGTVCQIKFYRREKSFELCQNFDSMYPRTITGSFVIEQDDYGNYIIDGSYDYQQGDWNSSYYVTELTLDGSMTWTSTSDPSDVSIYRKLNN